MDHLTGPGYRKALEYLIKDYLKWKDLNKFESIVSETSLRNLIQHHIQDADIKNLADRALDIGNDLTHFIQYLDDLDVIDLKNLIELTAAYVDLEYRKRRALREPQTTQ